jgi:hypothetical protein
VEEIRISHICKCTFLMCKRDTFALKALPSPYSAHAELVADVY